MTQIATIPQGSDITATFTVTDSNGTALNLNTYAGIAVYLYRCNTRKIIAKYTKVAAAGHTLLTVTNAAAGEFEIYIPRSLTQNLSKDELRAEIKLRKVDAAGESGMMYTVATDIIVNYLEQSIAPTLTIP